MKTTPFRPAAQSRAAFTLVDLLAVLLLASLGVLVLVPALAGTRPGSQAAQCLNNMRQLMAAATLYTHDHSDLLPPNPDDGNSVPGYNWVAGIVSGWMPNPSAGGSGDAGNADFLTNPKTSLLAPYLSDKAGVFKCPADPRICPYTGSDPSLRGQYIPVVRSVSMNGGVGTIDPGFGASGGSHSGRPTLPVNGPWLDGTHSHRANQPYATFGKTTDFKIVRPSDIWVHVDDDPWSINDACMAVIAAQASFVDWCSPLHANATGFSFADGHAEIHKWQSNTFIHNGVPSRTIYNSSQPQYQDWFWWAAHATRNTQTGTVP